MNKNYVFNVTHSTPSAFLHPDMDSSSRVPSPLKLSLLDSDPLRLTRSTDQLLLWTPEPPEECATFADRCPDDVEEGSRESEGLVGERIFEASSAKETYRY